MTQSGGDPMRWEPMKNFARGFPLSYARY